jgi:hypothetical protein
MKKTNLILMAFVSLFTVVALSSCSKDDDDNVAAASPFDGHLSGTIIKANGGALSGEVDMLKTSIFTAPVSADGKFDFTLPVPPNSELNVLFDEDVPSGVSITPSDAKGFSLYEIGAYKSGQNVGYVYYGKNDYSVEAYPYYVNKDVVIKGSFNESEDGYTYSETYNMNLKAGWNYVIAREQTSGNSSTHSVTSGNVPSDLQWLLVN